MKVRFVDMSEYDEKVSSDVGVYYSVETNYRLFLFSELFSAYDRMIYLDCDTVVTGDISRLFDMPLNGSAIGAAADVGVRVLSYTKRAVFFEKKPYNIYYCEKQWKSNTYHKRRRPYKNCVHNALHSNSL